MDQVYSNPFIVIRTQDEVMAPHNDVLVNDGPHIRRLFYKITILKYHCVTTAHSIQYSNMLYRFVA
jgi:hypothetical protein